MSKLDRNGFAAPLLFGASSQVGEALLPQLVEAGHQPRAVSRQPARQPIEGVDWELGCFGSTRLPAPAVLCVGPLLPFAVWLEDQPIGLIERIIAVSSLSLRHKRDAADAAERRTAALLAEGEARLCAAADRLGADWSLLRPAMLYGKGRDGTVARALDFGRRHGWLPLPVPASGLRQPLHLDDFADAIVQCLHGAASRSTLELGGGERLTLRELLERVAQALPGCRLLRLPAMPLRWASAALAPLASRARELHAVLDRAGKDQLPDEELARRLLDWRPRRFKPGPTAS
jgi:nucleoside-diphosphate-sugar epimerase